MKKYVLTAAAIVAVALLGIASYFAIMGQQPCDFGPCQYSSPAR